MIRNKTARNARVLLTGLCVLAHCATLSAYVLENRDYRLEVLADGVVEVRAGEATSILRPEFTVMFSDKEPGYHRNNSNYPLAPRHSIRWANHQMELEDLRRWLQDDLGIEVEVTEDEEGIRVWDYPERWGTPAVRYRQPDGGWRLVGPYAQGTTNPFAAGKRTTLRPSQTSRSAGGAIIWRFPEQPGFSLVARLLLPQPHGDPQITYRFTAKDEGYYSAAFTGAPGIAVADSVTVPQSAAGRFGFSQFGHLVAEINEKLPRAHVSDGTVNAIIVVDPEEAPFKETMATYASSRFGTMIRRENGLLAPMVFAPIMGGAESKMDPGDEHQFTVRYVQRKGNWKESYRYVAKEIYEFRDMRDNSGTGSLNDTIANVVDFLLDRHGGNHAMWHEEQKYYNYWSDKSGIFKPFSPLFGLAAAVVLDDEELYRRRALPIVEFALSRVSNVFSPYDVEDTQQLRTQDRRLGRPYVNAPQLTSLWSFYQERTYAFHHYADEAGFGNNIMGWLGAYRLSGEPEHLEAAVRAADRTLESDAGHYFDFLEVYEAGGEERFLDAAAERAYAQVAGSINLFPPVPDEKMTFDRGGKVPVHAHSHGRHRLWGFPPPEGLPIQEQTVAAWRGSEIGLESFSHHRAELWMNHQPQFLRIAAHLDDPFLRNVARWGVIGRYGNYPGDNRTERSLVTELPDAPEHPIWKQTYTSFNPGHAWEVIGAMVDFLVTDAFERSGGAIAFPAATMAGSAFRVNVYGDRPGRFYDEENVRLWLPRDLMTIDNPQIDFLAGYGNGKLYVAFWNQAFDDQAVEVRFNPERVDIASSAGIRAWNENRETEGALLDENHLRFTVPGKGIHAFAVDGAVVRRALQAKMFDPDAISLGPESVTVMEAPFGDVDAMLLTMGRGLTNAFVYTDALPEDVIIARLHYRQGNADWEVMEDEVFPFEFSVWLDEDAGDFEFIFEVETIEQRWERSPRSVLAFGTEETR